MLISKSKRVIILLTTVFCNSCPVSSSQQCCQFILVRRWNVTAFHGIIMEATCQAIPVSLKCRGDQYVIRRYDNITMKERLFNIKHSNKYL